MAPCKTTLDANDNVQVAAAALPISCKLKTPTGIKGVTIAEAEYFLPNSDTGTPCPLAGDGQSFTFPAPSGIPKGTTVDLFVRVIGNYPAATTIDVVEDCDSQTVVMSITDGKTKFAYATVEVE